MFSTATKIQVLASNAKKGSAGPRKGSTGYVLECSFVEYAKDISCLLYVCRVLFNRYGFEKKERKEMKAVTLLFPLPMLKHVTTSPVKTLINRLNNRKKPHRCFADIRLNPQTLIAVKDKPSDLRDDNEFLCWLESYMKTEFSTNFLSSFIAANNNRLSSAGIDKTIINLIVNAAYDSHTLSAEVKNLLLSKKHTIINSINKAIAVSDGQQAVPYKNYIEEVLRDNHSLSMFCSRGFIISRSQMLNALPVLADNMYNDKCYSVLKNYLLSIEKEDAAKKHSSIQMSTMLHNIEIVKKYLKTKVK